MIEKLKQSETLKRLVRITPLYRLFLIRQYLKEVKVWESRGCAVPVPHLIKQRTIIECAEKYGLRVLVETGTYYGAMIEAMKDSFDLIYSIELDRYLYERAKERFTSARNVEIIHGDSGVELKKVVKR